MRPCTIPAGLNLIRNLGNYPDYSGGRKWQPTPAFLPGGSHGHSSLEGYNPQGHKRVGHKLVNSSNFSFTSVNFSMERLVEFSKNSVI